MAFNHKLISVSLSTGSGVSLGGGGGNSYTASGLRTTVRIQKVTGASMGQADVAIYGLPLSIMNQLSTVGTQYTQVSAQNQMTISAGDTDTGLSQIYTGTITWAFVDAQNMPEVAFRVTALAGVKESAMPTTPLSFKGSTDVAMVAQKMASAAGLQFENHGVSVKLADPYFSGSPRSMILALCQHAGLTFIIDKNKLDIWPAGQGSNSGVVISKDTGMVGYPQFDQKGIIVRTLYNPAIEFNTIVTVKSDLTPANGPWLITELEYELESLVPHGKWFQIIHGMIAGSPQTTSPPASNA